MKRLSQAWVVLLLMLLGLTACSAAPPLPPSPSLPNVNSPVPVPSVSATPGEAALGPVVASRSGSIGGAAVDLDLYEIVRADHLAYLSFTIRSAERVRLNEAFGDPTSHDYEADGISLIDAEHKKLYLVASHGNGTCVCSATGAIVLGEKPTVISAAFAAPPAGVTSVDVQIPGFGVFAHVPLV